MLVCSHVSECVRTGHSCFSQLVKGVAMISLCISPLKHTWHGYQAPGFRKCVYIIQKGFSCFDYFSMRELPACSVADPDVYHDCNLHIRISSDFGSCPIWEKHMLHFFLTCCVKVVEVTGCFRKVSGEVRSYSQLHSERGASLPLEKPPKSTKYFDSLKNCSVFRQLCFQQLQSSGKLFYFLGNFPMRYYGNCFTKHI